MPHDAVDPISVEQVCDELIELRGAHGRLTVHKLARHPLLVRLCGDDDLIDGYLAFKREMERLTRGSKYEAALAWSILADADSVLDRLTLAAEHLSEGEPKDQRTIRHWSDRGMLSVAHDLVAFAAIRGNTGQDLIGITIAATSSRIQVQIIQVASLQLSRRAPVITITAPSEHDEAPTPATIDLEHAKPDYEASGDTTSTREYRVVIARQPDHGPLKIAIMARRSPTPTFFLRDETPESLSVCFAVHRSLVEIDLTTAE
ncbi:hypothetical protein [Rhodococcus sp. Chr-9]|uniref:hypothetical protein n=1 Tax=Rhodococcus sp. Chr-9 TaxID=713612 RepID=UPI0005739817|nr:hypothetical protein [Rhodococcus sp. Chr-9]KHJ74248.1 hypothetical protein QR64_02510 [Rhodococcus sp. Chr-9]